jgi:hypothetical protein
MALSLPSATTLAVNEWHRVGDALPLSVRPTSLGLVFLRAGLAITATMRGTRRMAVRRVPPVIFGVHGRNTGTCKAAGCGLGSADRDAQSSGERDGNHEKVTHSISMIRLLGGLYFVGKLVVEFTNGKTPGGEAAWVSARKNPLGIKGGL